MQAWAGFNYIYKNLFPDTFCHQHIYALNLCLSIIPNKLPALVMKKKKLLKNLHIFNKLYPSMYNIVLCHLTLHDK